MMFFASRVLRAFLTAFFIFLFCAASAASAEQADDLSFVLDINSNTTPTSRIFSPNIDLSGRGIHPERSWPQELSTTSTLESWSKDIGFSGFYRLQFNLWEVTELAKEQQLQEKMLINYEGVIERVNSQGGVIILNFFGTPPGLGKVLDKKSVPWDLKAFKELVKKYVEEFSCKRKYNIWYEVWSAPDLDTFFLGNTEDYLRLYKAVAESVSELEAAYGVNIPLGGPSTSWWFQAPGGNTVATPEKSLIYELIKFCSQNKLPLDFISWHAYSTDPKAEREKTPYNNMPVSLIRDWLTYFNLKKDTALLVDEWNYDREDNLLEERQEKSSITASYMFSRLNQFYAAGVDCQVFFSLEDFQDKEEGVIRNVGVFMVEPEPLGGEARPKAIYNAFKMLKLLGPQMYPLKSEDDFVGIIPTKLNNTDLAIIIYNYIDPNIYANYLSRNISTLNEAERASLLEIVRSNGLQKIINKETDASSLQLSQKIKSLFASAQILQERSQRLLASPRSVRLEIKNIGGNYLYSKYCVDAGCGLDCKFVPSQEKEISLAGFFSDTLLLEPYSSVLVILKILPKEAAIQQEAVKKEQAATEENHQEKAEAGPAGALAPDSSTNSTSSDKSAIPEQEMNKTPENATSF